MHEDSMKKLQGDCVFWLVLLTRAAQLLPVCGNGSPGMFNFHDLCQPITKCAVYSWDQLSSTLYLTAHIRC